MTIEQGSQPPYYDELFTGFAGLAALHGVVNHGPLQSEYEPGKDGTLTPDGEQATGYGYTIPNDELPQAVIELGVDNLDIGSYSATVMDEDVWSEHVWVYAHEPVGYRKAITFHKAYGTNEITATFAIKMDDAPDHEIGSGLSDDEKGEIITDLFAGNRFWIDLEGPSGEFARAVHIAMTSPDEPDANDIDRLHKIYVALKK